VILMRAAGCVMNDIADRDFDPHVKRTRERPLASGELQLRDAMIAFVILMALAFGLVLLTNALTVKLALVGALLASAYPFFKRFTHLPQVVLGIAFGWGIPMAFAAETGSVPVLAWWLLAVNTVWAVIYDTEYAMVDRDDDLDLGIKSTAILFGRFDVPIIMALMILMLALLTVSGHRAELLWPWYVGVAACAVLFGRQLLLIRGREREPCFRAFLNNNWAGLAIFLGLLLHFFLDGAYAG
jgi:4-hydroxybenzoate polyprenyltransferase